MTRFKDGEAFSKDLRTELTNYKVNFEASPTAIIVRLYGQQISRLQVFIWSFPVRDKVQIRKIGTTGTEIFRQNIKIALSPVLSRFRLVYIDTVKVQSFYWTVKGTVFTAMLRKNEKFQHHLVLTLTSNP